MKNKCSCYHMQKKKKYTYNPVTGHPIGHDVDVGICYGTKEMEECSCGGDETKCDFYQDVREKAENLPIEDAIPCQYCSERNNEFVLLNNTRAYSGIEFAINRQGMLRVRFYEDFSQIWFSEDIVNIKYCPMCGRKFSN